MLSCLQKIREILGLGNKKVSGVKLDLKTFPQTEITSFV